ncbi:H-NS family nucleoid-associated regulatory protein [Tabrizicola sp.]|uniref:H-NS histone family protein n=1 Tax=Tabrizicola sp. TaxID=2005166 RepID=UPI003D26B24A
MDIKSLSLEELKELSSNIDRAIADYEERRKREALAKLEITARSLGFSLSELVGEGKLVGKRKRASVKYRHPDNATLTWTGRGRQPRWVKLLLSSGGSLSDLLI